MFDDYDWISEEPSSYGFSGNESSYYEPEYTEFQYSPSYGLNYDSPSILDYSPSLGDSGMDLGGFTPASFDVSGYQPYSFSDVLPGSELIGASPISTDFGTDFAISSVDNPYMRAAMSDVGNTNYGFDPSVQIAAQSGEAIPMGDGMYDYNGQLIDGQTLAQLMDRSPLPMSYSPEALRSGVYGAFPVGSFPDDPRQYPSSSYLDRNGDVVGLTYGTDTPADFQNPYEYRMADNGEAYIQNIMNGETIGWLDGVDPRYYQDERIANNVANGLASLYGVQRPGSPGSSIPGATSGYKAPTSGSSSPTSQKAPTYNAKGNTPTSQALRDVGSAAAMIAALLGSGDKKSPESSQGSISANPWEVARMKNRGVYTPMAEGGSVLAKIREIYSQYGPGANRTERRRGPDRADPRQLMVDNGMVQNASRAISGRQRQLDELERQAVQGMAMGGAVFPSTVSPRLVKHASGGQADKVPIAASGGEYVFDADSVAALGDGNTDAGAAVLDKMRKNLRKHKRSAPPTKIPPKAKSPLEYMKGR